MLATVGRRVERGKSWSGEMVTFSWLRTRRRRARDSSRAMLVWREVIRAGIAAARVAAVGVSVEWLANINEAIDAADVLVAPFKAP